MGVFQPGAEMTATSSDLSSDHKIQSFLSAAKSTGVSNNLPLRMDNESATRQDDVPPPVMLESLRGKVDALKQVWCHDRMHLFINMHIFFLMHSLKFPLYSVFCHTTYWNAGLLTFLFFEQEIVGGMKNTECCTLFLLFFLRGERLRVDELSGESLSIWLQTGGCSTLLQLEYSAVGFLLH